MGAKYTQFYVGNGGAGGTSYVNTQDSSLPLITEATYKDGNTTMPTFDGTSSMTGNNTNGYAKITYIRDLSDDNSLKQLKISYDNGESYNINLGEQAVLDKSFNTDTNEYNITLDPDITKINIEGVLNDDLSTINGNGIYDIGVGTTQIDLKVTAESGKVRDLKINFNRKISTNAYLKGIKIAGQEIENFEPTKLNYDITLPYNLNEKEAIEGIKSSALQTIEGEGEYEISYNEKLFTLKVTAEDGMTTAIYNLNLKKEDTTKLKNCDINKDQDFSNIFKSDQFNYDYNVSSGIVTLNITAIPYDPDCTVKIKGAGYLKEGENIVTITVSKDGLEPSI